MSRAAATARREPVAGPSTVRGGAQAAGGGPKGSPRGSGSSGGGGGGGGGGSAMINGHDHAARNSKGAMTGAGAAAAQAGTSSRRTSLDSGAPTQEEIALFSTLSAYADALDALPLDLTRSFSDLRELDAVLGTHLNSLTNRLTQLTAIVEDPKFSQGERLLALKEVAEEARGYKMGGEDKIRVALNTAEMIISHTTYIDGLLANITSVPALAAFLEPAKNAHLAGHLADGTPLAPGSGPGGNNPANTNIQAEPVASPSKKKRPTGSAVQAAAVQAAAATSAAEKRLAQEAAGTGPHATTGSAGKKRKAPAQTATSKARANAAAIGTDSDMEATTSTVSAKRPAVKRAKANGSAANSGQQQSGLLQDKGDDSGSKGSAGTGEEISTAAARSRAARNNRKLGAAARGGGDDSDRDEEGVSDADAGVRPARVARAPRLGGSEANALPAATGGGEDTDERRYCFCNNVSYGDMIGCDDDDCEREWFHLECVGLLKPPQGTWYCDDCAQKRAQSRNKSKNRKLAKTSGAHGGGVVETKARSSGAKR